MPATHPSSSRSGPCPPALHLWIHENLRCFQDRLSTPQDRRFFTEQLMLEVLRRTFPGTSQLRTLGRDARTPSAVPTVILSPPSF